MDSTAAAQMNSTAWTTLVNRIEYVLSGGLQLGALMLLSLPLCGHFCRRQWLALKGGGMAGSLLLYQLAQVGFLLPSLLYNGYTLWAWLGLGAQFSVPAMFWLGVWPQAANLVVSNAMCFLALDRCFILLWPTSYAQRTPQRWLIFLNLASGLFILMASVAHTFILEFPLDEVKASKCANFPCVLTKYQSKYSAIFYTGQELVNLAVSLCFFVLVRRNTAAVAGIGATHNANMQRNRIVLVTLFLEMLFKAVPGLLAALVKNLTSIFLFNYLGWYIMLFTSLDSLAISIYFVFALLNRPKFLIRKKHNKNMPMMVNTVLPAPKAVAEHLAKNNLKI